MLLRYQRDWGGETRVQGPFRAACVLFSLGKLLLDNLNQPLSRIWFWQENSVIRQLIVAEVDGTRGNNELNVRSPYAHFLREAEAVWITWHVDVSEHHADRGTFSQHVKRLGRISSFPRRNPPIHERVSGRHANERLVLDHEHFLREIFRHSLVTQRKFARSCHGRRML